MNLTYFKIFFTWIIKKKPLIHNHKKPQWRLSKSGILLAQSVVCHRICVPAMIWKETIYTISKEQAIERNDVVFVDIVRNSLQN